MDKIAMLNEVIVKKNLKMDLTSDGKLVMEKGHFEVGSSLPETDAVMKSASGGEYGEATDEDLAKINKKSRRKFAKEDVLVLELHSANTKVDRGYEHFTKEALQNMADMSPNKPVLTNHAWKTDSVVGKIFEAEVRNNTLVQKVYIPRRSQAKAVEAVLDGIWDKVSVGFAMAPEDYVCDSCKKSLFDSDCTHWPGYADEKGKTTTVTLAKVSDYFEISFVPVPMQADAGTAKEAEIEETLAVSKEAGEDFTESILKIAEAMKESPRGLVLTDEEITKIAERVGHAILAQRPDTLPVKAAEAVLNILEAQNISTDAELEDLIKGNKESDTISTVKTTIEDSSQMADEEDKPTEVTEEVEAPAEAEEAEEEVAAEEVIEEEKAAEAPVVKAAPAIVKLDASAVEAATLKIEALMKGVEPLVEAQKSLETKLAEVSETLDRLEKLVKAASNASLDSLKDCFSSQKEEAVDKHWFVEAFGSDLGGQE